MHRAGAIALAGFLCTSGQTHAACVLYEPEIATLSGTIVPMQSYGAPGYWEDPERDTIEHYRALKLDAPLCVLQTGKDESDTDERDVRMVQLVFAKPPYRATAGHVQVTGTLFRGITGHHHTAALMQVQRVNR